MLKTKDEKTINHEIDKNVKHENDENVKMTKT